MSYELDNFLSFVEQLQRALPYIKTLNEYDSSQRPFKQDEGRLADFILESDKPSFAGKSREEKLSAFESDFKSLQGDLGLEAVFRQKYKHFEIAQLLYQSALFAKLKEYKENETALKGQLSISIVSILASVNARLRQINPDILVTEGYDEGASQGEQLAVLIRSLPKLHSDLIFLQGYDKAPTYNHFGGMLHAKMDAKGGSVANPIFLSMAAASAAGVLILVGAYIVHNMVEAGLFSVPDLALLTTMSTAPLSVVIGIPLAAVAMMFTAFAYMAYDRDNKVRAKKYLQLDHGYKVSGLIDPARKEPDVDGIKTSSRVLTTCWPSIGGGKNKRYVTPSKSDFNLMFTPNNNNNNHT